MKFKVDLDKGQIHRALVEYVLSRMDGAEEIEATAGALLTCATDTDTGDVEATNAQVWVDTDPEPNDDRPQTEREEELAVRVAELELRTLRMEKEAEDWKKEAKSNADLIFDYQQAADVLKARLLEAYRQLEKLSRFAEKVKGNRNNSLVRDSIAVLTKIEPIVAKYGIMSEEDSEE